MPDGTVIDVNNVVFGRTLSDGSVINQAGSLVGEIAEGDIVIDNADKVAGYVDLAGNVVSRDRTVIGRSLSGGLAIDANDNILGRIYKSARQFLEMMVNIWAGWRRTAA